MKKIKLLNYFGIDPNSSNAKKEPFPYKIAVSGDVKYVCFFETGSKPRAIHKIVGDTVLIGYGKWDDREKLDYYPPTENMLMQVEVEL